MALSRSGITAIVLNTDPHAKEKLSGPNLAATMAELCGAVHFTGATPAPARRRDHKPHM
jgi:hypothetical protein